MSFPFSVIVILNERPFIFSLVRSPCFSKSFELRTIELEVMPTPFFTAVRFRFLLLLQYKKIRIEGATLLLKICFWFAILIKGGIRLLVCQTTIDTQF